MINGEIIAISDVHGAYEQTETLLTYLEKSKLLNDKWVIFLGDYVDTGPDTKQTIDLLIAFGKYHSKTLFLCGNHDQNLIKALNLIDNPHQQFYWNRIMSRNRQTLKSYKARNGQELLELMPETHKEFLKNLVWHVEHPEFLFVHCGLDNEESYEQQIIKLRSQNINMFKPKWLYDDYIAFDNPENITDKTVVSGHKILNTIVNRNKRIMIDTGAGYGGLLTAALLPERKFLQV